MGAEIEKTIDIDKILRDKMGAKAKFVPSFAVNWLKESFMKMRLISFYGIVVVCQGQNGSRNVLDILT